jgi:uncharacterized repeat protein (TIGR01451 family)
MKKALFAILALGVLAVSTPKVYADCQLLYGGGETCTSYNFTIDKKVQVPGKGGGNYVDNLWINDARYSPSQTIKYQLIVTNTGTDTIPTINIVDTFPQYISFVSGAGTYNSNSKTLSITINNLGGGQSQTINLQAVTADSKTVPVGVVCDDRTKNQVNADDTHGDTGYDSSQVCIQNSTAVLPATTVKTTPATGPEMLPLALLLPGALGGILLRKKTQKGGKK